MSASSSKKKTTKKVASTGSAVKVPIGLPKAKASDKKTRYLMGTLPECPIQNVAAGGHTFPRFRGNPVFDGPKYTPSTQIVHGIEVELTDEQVDSIKNGVRIRVVRIAKGRNEMNDYEDVPGFSTPIRKKETRARIYMIDSKKYRPKSNDVPLAKLLYMHRLDEMNAIDLRAFPYESMAGPQEDESAPCDHQSVSTGSTAEE